MKHGRWCLVFWIVLIGLWVFRSSPAMAAVSLLEDSAGLLGETERKALEAQAAELAESSGFDILLATTKDTQGRSSETYAEDFYLAHCSGEDGAVYLIDLYNREIYIATSGEMIYYLTDARIEKCLDAGYDAVSSGAYETCFAKMLTYSKRYVESGSGADYYRDRDTGEVIWTARPKRISRMEGLLALAAGLLASVGSALGIRTSYRRKSRKYQYDYRAGSTLNLVQKRDQFLTKSIRSRRIQRDPPSSSGGMHGGGSTVHTGSGGHSFGGGGRKF